MNDLKDIYNDRRRFVQIVECTIRRVFPDIDITKACFYYALVGHRVADLVYNNPNVIPIAGNASFRVVREADDDGISATHMSYVFNTEPESIEAMKAGNLPEMHVWLADMSRMGSKDPRVLCMDMTSKYQTGRSKEDGGIVTDNPFELPETAFWEVGQPLKGLSYLPVSDANTILRKFIDSSFGYADIMTKTILTIAPYA